MDYYGMEMDEHTVLEEQHDWEVEPSSALESFYEKMIYGHEADGVDPISSNLWGELHEVRDRGTYGLQKDLDEEIYKRCSMMQDFIEAMLIHMSKDEHSYEAEYYHSKFCK